MEADLRVMPTGDWDPGDPESFGRMYDEHFPRVYNYIRYRVRDAAAADDLTSLTFHKALDRRDAFDPGRGAVATWLLAIARNAVHDHLRTRDRRRSLLDRWWPRGGDAVPDPESILIDEQERDRLLAALAQLPDRDRDVLGLKFGAGNTNRAIGELTGWSESNVGVIVHRALARLRVLLDDERRVR